MAKRKIAYVIATLHHGGAEHQLYYLLRGLDRDRFEPVVACLREGGVLEPMVLELGIPVHHFDRRHRADVWAVARLASWLHRESPDVVHTWLPTSNLWGRTAAILAGCRAMVAAERSVDSVQHGIRRLVDRTLAKRTKTIIGNSDAVKCYLSRSVGIPGDKIVTIYNGLDLDSIDRVKKSGSAWKRKVTSEQGFPEGALIVGTVAGIRRYKALHDFITVAARVHREIPESRFVIVGGAVFADEREYLSQLEVQIVDEGLEGKVVVTGFQDRPIEYLLGMDVYIQTSLVEGLPNAVMEAMGCGLPIVATDVGGTKELIEEGISGFLVSKRDVPTASARVMQLLRNPDQLRAMGKAGASRMRKDFSIDVYVRSTETVYCRALGDLND